MFFFGTKLNLQCYSDFYSPHYSRRHREISLLPSSICWQQTSTRRRWDGRAPSANANKQTSNVSALRLTSISPSVNQSIDRLLSQSINQPINQSSNQSINQRQCFTNVLPICLQCYHWWLLSKTLQKYWGNWQVIGKHWKNICVYWLIDWLIDRLSDRLMDWLMAIGAPTIDGSWVCLFPTTWWRQQTDFTTTTVMRWIKMAISVLFQKV